MIRVVEEWAIRVGEERRVLLSLTWTLSQRRWQKSSVQINYEIIWKMCNLIFDLCFQEASQKCAWIKIRRFIEIIIIIVFNNSIHQLYSHEKVPKIWRIDTSLNNRKSHYEWFFPPVIFTTCTDLGEGKQSNKLLKIGWFVGSFCALM